MGFSGKGDYVPVCDDSRGSVARPLQSWPFWPAWLMCPLVFAEPKLFGLAVPSFTFVLCMCALLILLVFGLTRRLRMSNVCGTGRGGSPPRVCGSARPPFVASIFQTAAVSLRTPRAAVRPARPFEPPLLLLLALCVVPASAMEADFFDFSDGFVDSSDYDPCDDPFDLPGSFYGPDGDPGSVMRYDRVVAVGALVGALGRCLRSRMMAPWHALLDASIVQQYEQADQRAPAAQCSHDQFGRAIVPAPCLGLLEGGRPRRRFHSPAVPASVALRFVELGPSPILRAAGRRDDAVLEALALCLRVVGRGLALFAATIFDRIRRDVWRHFATATLGARQPRRPPRRHRRSRRPAQPTQPALPAPARAARDQQ